MQQERDELYRRFTAAVLEVQQKAGFRNLVLERKLQALSTAVEKKEVQFSEVLAASNLDPTALTLVSRKLEVGRSQLPPRPSTWSGLWLGAPCLASVMSVQTLSRGERLPGLGYQAPTLSLALLLSEVTLAPSSPVGQLSHQALHLKPFSNLWAQSWAFGG